MYCRTAHIMFPLIPVAQFVGLWIMGAGTSPSIQSRICLNVLTGGLFLIGQDPKRTLCSNAITAATQFSNARCAMQGTLSIFGGYIAGLTMFARLLQLHLQVRYTHDETTFSHVIDRMAAFARFIQNLEHKSNQPRSLAVSSVP